MARRNIHVPFEEKDSAKALGARWDSALRTWYIPDGISEESFVEWFEPRPEILPDPPDFSSTPMNRRLDKAGILDDWITCHQCRTETPVLTIVEFDQDGDLDGITGVEAVDAALRQALEPFPYFKRVYSRTQQRWLMGNCCVYCDALQGDFFLHSEPDGPFFALHHLKDHDRVRWIDGPVEVLAD